MHRHVQVARGGAAQPGLALPRQPNALPVFDTRGNPHVDGAGAGGDAGALALVAGVLDDRAAAPAIRAGLGETERALVAVDHAGAVASGTHLRAGARARATAMAIGARGRAGQPQRHRHAFGGLDEIQLGLGLEVVAAAGPAGTGAGAASEQSAEQVTDVGATTFTRGVEQIVEVELGAITAGTEPAETPTVEPASAETAAREQAAGLVVLLALGRIRQHVVRLRHRFESFAGGRIVGIGVRVQVTRQLAVGALDLFGSGVRGDAQLLIEVLLDPFTLGHIASPPLTFHFCCYVCSLVDCVVYSHDASALSSESAGPVSVVLSADPPAVTVSSPATVSTTPTRAWRNTFSPSR